MTKRKPENEMNKEANSPRQGRLSRETQAKIGEQLRKMHDDIVQEGVPERFMKLLSQLDGKNPDEA
jgi:hemerythrin-like domain-containing protein